MLKLQGRTITEIAEQAGDIHFLVLQDVDGDDLSTTVKTSGPLAVDLAIRCLMQTARGLEYAHQAGVVHRDIKPSNLVVAKNGVVKILDVGLARLEKSLSDASLVIEADGQEVAAALHEQGIRVHNANSGRGFTLTPGRHHLKSGEYQVDAAQLPAGLEISTNQFRLKRSGSVTLLVTLARPADNSPEPAVER